MATDDEARLSDEELAASLDEPGSIKEVKPTPSEALQRALAEFESRAQGLSGDALQGAVDQLVDRIVENTATALPRGLQDELRRTVREMMEHDPAMQAIVGDLRAAAARR